VEPGEHAEPLGHRPQPIGQREQDGRLRSTVHDGESVTPQLARQSGCSITHVPPTAASGRTLDHARRVVLHARYPASGEPWLTLSCLARPSRAGLRRIAFIFRIAWSTSGVSALLGAPIGVIAMLLGSFTTDLFQSRTAERIYDFEREERLRLSRSA
jgi:hypothetical protein